MTKMFQMLVAAVSASQVSAIKVQGHEGYQLAQDTIDEMEMQALKNRRAEEAQRSEELARIGNTRDTEKRMQEVARQKALEQKKAKEAEEQKLLDEAEANKRYKEETAANAKKEAEERLKKEQEQKEQKAKQDRALNDQREVEEKQNKKVDHKKLEGMWQTKKQDLTETSGANSQLAEKLKRRQQMNAGSHKSSSVPENDVFTTETKLSDAQKMRVQMKAKKANWVPLQNAYRQKIARHELTQLKEAAATQAVEVENLDAVAMPAEEFAETVPTEAVTEPKQTEDQPEPVTEPKQTENQPSCFSRFFSWFKSFFC